MDPAAKKPLNRNDLMKRLDYAVAHSRDDQMNTIADMLQLARSKLDDLMSDC